MITSNLIYICLWQGIFCYGLRQLRERLSICYKLIFVSDMYFLQSKVQSWFLAQMFFSVGLY
jgi:hypothetical protein